MSITVGSGVFEIFKIDYPIRPYIVIEDSRIGRSGSHIIHVLCFEKCKEIRIGRGHGSELRVPDISVSRCHASIVYENGHFYLKDSASKFGTLANAPPQFIIRRN